MIRYYYFSFRYFFINVELFLGRMCFSFKVWDLQWLSEYFFRKEGGGDKGLSYVRDQREKGNNVDRY